MALLNDEMLKNVSGGKLDPTTEDQLTCWLQTLKDQGTEYDDALNGIINDFNNQIEYHDLIDTDGNKVTLDALKVYVEQIWNSIS